MSQSSPLPVVARTWLVLARIAARNVVRGWRHSVAAMGTMALGFVALATFQGYLGEMMSSQLEMNFQRNMLGDIVVRHADAGSPDAKIHPHRYWVGPAELAVLDRWVQQHPTEVLVRVRSMLVPGMASANGRSAAFYAFGHDVVEGETARRAWAWNAWAGRPLQPGDTNHVQLGLGLARLLGCEPTGQGPVFDPRTALLVPVARPFRCTNPSLQLSAGTAGGRTNALDAEVIGLSSGQVREFDLRVLWAPLPFVQQLVQTDSIGVYNIVLRDPNSAAVLRPQLAEVVRAAGLRLEVVNWLDTENGDLFRRGTEMLAVFRNLVVFVLLVIAGSAVLTTMAKTVRERTREIGTLRSLGFGRGDMQVLFGLEAALLAMVSGVVGIVLAAGLRLAVNGAGITYRAGLLNEDMKLAVGWDPLVYATGFMFLAGVAVLASWLAARRVVGLRVAEALTGA